MIQQPKNNTEVASILFKRILPWLTGLLLIPIIVFILAFVFLWHEFSKEFYADRNNVIASQNFLTKHMHEQMREFDRRMEENALKMKAFDRNFKKATDAFDRNFNSQSQNFDKAKDEWTKSFYKHLEEDEKENSKWFDDRAAEMMKHGKEYLNFEKK